MRASGSQCELIYKSFLINSLKPRVLTYSVIRSSFDGSIIDKCLVVFFRRGASFTGEDCLEFQLHGSAAIVRRMISEILEIDGVRLAEAGEFTRRAFENGQLDLSSVEGLNDLLRADTESQRVQAVSRAFGGFDGLVRGWRDQLIDILVRVEAELDFSDEGDVGNLNISNLILKIKEFKEMIQISLDNFDYGRIINDGIRVGIGGLPNVGKSSIINQISKSETSIVTSTPGTTRDIVEVRVDIGGQLVIFSDSAGIRKSSDEIEMAGVKRAHAMFERSDVVLWVSAPDVVGSDIVPQMRVPVLHVSNKADIGICSNADLNVSAQDGDLSSVTDAIISQFCAGDADRSSLIFSRERDRIALNDANSILSSVLDFLNSSTDLRDLELIAEDLRRVSFALERLLGKVDSEILFDELFSGFCIGK
ncbi:MAG: tRNA uridine-5-carboxymethylaminomethyl(34) synthesis GTPase MnmE [Devosiaceae bacterium]|nr:tRNA uridine-5-carboxymethylaminomethyl(34) synthesis GTPase MnmE [Devosiaceae bacterium]